MSDPAVEAAQRAWASNEALDGIDYSPGEGGFWTPDAMEAAAREALKPIRELHVPVVHDDEHTSERWAECRECLGAHWPCATAELIYTTEELAR